jgi:hypothetical protein
MEVTRRFEPEELITTAAEARSYLWSMLMTMTSIAVALVALAVDASGLAVIAFVIFLAGAISGNLLTNRVVRRLGTPRSVLGFHVLRSRVGFALYSPQVVRRAIRVTRRPGEQIE